MNVRFNFVLLLLNPNSYTGIFTNTLGRTKADTELVLNQICLTKAIDPACTIETASGVGLMILVVSIITLIILSARQDRLGIGLLWQLLLQLTLHQVTEAFPEVGIILKCQELTVAITITKILQATIL